MGISYVTMYSANKIGGFTWVDSIVLFIMGYS